MSSAVVEVSHSKPNKGLNVGLWVAQVLLALVFAMAGWMKAVTPIDVLAQKMSWVSHAPWLARFVGASELAAAIGLILPWATGIARRLTAWAGVGLATIMALAIGFHLVNGEVKGVPIVVILLALSSFVAWGRSRKP